MENPARNVWVLLIFSAAARTQECSLSKPIRRPKTRRVVTGKDRCHTFVVARVDAATVATAAARKCSGPHSTIADNFHSLIGSMEWSRNALDAQQSIRLMCMQTHVIVHHFFLMSMCVCVFFGAFRPLHAVGIETCAMSTFVSLSQCSFSSFGDSGHGRSKSYFILEMVRVK